MTNARVAVLALAHDVIIGLAVGAGFYGVAIRLVKARSMLIAEDLLLLVTDDATGKL